MAKGSKMAGTVVGTLLESTHFYDPAHRLIYEYIVEAYYADDPMDALTIGRVKSKPLAALWQCSEQEAIDRVRHLSDAQTFAGNISDHARLVKRDSDYRLLLGVATGIEEAVAKEELDPERLAGIVSQQGMRIATSALLTSDIKGFGELGREFINELRQMKEAADKGIELGAKFGLPFLDSYIRGLQPTELWILAGEPGAGKSAISWIAGLNFAQRQMQKDPDKRVGTFVASLEMGDLPSKMRLAQTLTGIDSGKMREGSITEQEIARIVHHWGQRQELPYWFNFTSSLRASQLRALIVEGVRRHNIGLVIIDHFKYFDMDRRYQNPNDEDEAKARFLKEDIAKDLNVAVICLAHTTKGIEANQNRRPNLSNLRGSGQVAAHADFVSFVYRPYLHATDEQISNGEVEETDAEMVFAKNRHGIDGIAEFFFEPARMRVR